MYLHDDNRTEKSNLIISNIIGCKDLKVLFNLLCMLITISFLWNTNIMAANISRTEQFNFTQEIVELAKSNLLQAFGVTSIPNKNKKVQTHEYMIQLYLRLERYRKLGGDGIVNTIRGLPSSDIGSSSRQRNSGSFGRLIFNITDLPLNEKMVFSELRVRSSSAHQSAHRKTTQTGISSRLFRIYLLGRKLGSTSPNTGWSQIEMVTLDTLSQDTQWIAFNIIDYIKQARFYQAKEIEFIIRVFDIASKKFVSSNEAGIETTGLNKMARPLVVLFLDDGLHTVTGKSQKTDNERKKRAPKERKVGKSKKKGGKKRNKNICRRKPMFVNFDDFGWTNWIIAPSGYEAFYCDGTCAYPIASHLNPTNHATIQSIVNSMDTTIISPSCCTPDRLTSISILYVDDNDRVVYKKKDDMVVESCGCR